jgi:hypothetical protein
MPQEYQDVSPWFFLQKTHLSQPGKLKYCQKRNDDHFPIF